MNRRGFLKMVGVAAPAIILTPGLLMPIRKILGVAEINFIQSGTGAHSRTVQEALRHADYVLYGDGIADDTVALQALIDGKPVEYAGQIIAAEEGRIVMPSASYLITQTLRFTNKQNLQVSRARFTAKGAVEPIMQFDSPCTGAISNCSFDTKGRWSA